MKKMIYSLIAICSFMFGYDEITLDSNQSQKLGIGLEAIDFSGYSMVGPFVANLGFSNQESIKQISPFEITITHINKLNGNFVAKGEVVCEIASDSLSNLVYEHQNTKSKLEIAKLNAQKDKTLYEEGVLSNREYQASYLLANELELKFKDLNNIIEQIGINTKMGRSGYPVVAKMSGILALAPTSIAQQIPAFSPYIVIVKSNEMLANIKIPSQYSTDIQKGAKIYSVSMDTKNENSKVIGEIKSIAIALDTKTNTINASGILNATNLKSNLKYGGTINVLVQTKNPPQTIAVKNDNVVKFGNDYVVFVKTQNGFMPTKINIVKEINNGYIIKQDKFSPNTKLANGAIVVLKGAMSDLGFE